LRLGADAMRSPEIRRQMLDIAAQYEQLAASLEAMKEDPQRSR
jgi:hypothetical protein